MEFQVLKQQNCWGSLWDLASYIGQSNIFETHVTNKISEKQRIKIVEDFFK